MSDENARKRAKKNQSDGAYLKGCTCPMQPAWLKLAPTEYKIAIHSETAGQTQQPWFNKWLSDGGMDAAQLYWCWTRRLTDVKGFIYALFVVLGPCLKHL